MKLKPCTHHIQYYETDQMAIVHHSNYIRWFEEARVDWFEQMGLPFAQVEAMGIQIPVVSCGAKYHTSARFGDAVEIYLERRRYNGVRLVIGYQVRSRGTGELLATGETEHCFTSPEGRILNLRRKFPQVDAVLDAPFTYG